MATRLSQLITTGLMMCLIGLVYFGILTLAFLELKQMFLASISGMVTCTRVMGLIIIAI